MQRLVPMPKFPVGQATGKTDVVVLTEDFYLPRSGPRELRTPRDASHRVLDGHERKPFAYRHGTDLAETLTEGPGSAPRAFQVKLLDALGVQPSLGTLATIS